MYVAGVGKRRDSWAGVAIYRAAKKGNYNLKGEDELILRAL